MTFHLDENGTDICVKLLFLFIYGVTRYYSYCYNFEFKIGKPI